MLRTYNRVPPVEVKIPFNRATYKSSRNGVDCTPKLKIQFLFFLLSRRIFQNTAPHQSIFINYKYLLLFTSISFFQFSPPIFFLLLNRIFFWIRYSSRVSVRIRLRLFVLSVNFRFIYRIVELGFGSFGFWIQGFCFSGADLFPLSPLNCGFRAFVVKEKGF